MRLLTLLSVAATLLAQSETAVRCRGGRAAKPRGHRRFFPAQPANVMGNMTRYNPKFRSNPIYANNVSIAKSFPLKEQIRLDFRMEMFNAANWARFNMGSLNLQAQQFGVLSNTAGDQGNSPRQIQFALKLYF